MKQITMIQHEVQCGMCLSARFTLGLLMQKWPVYSTWARGEVFKEQ